MDASSPPQEIFFLPFIAPSHMIPLFEMARLFAARGQHVTVITTPTNASALQPTIDIDLASGHLISLHAVPFPAAEVGLPSGLENFSAATDTDTVQKLFRGFTLLRPAIEEFIVTARPDCIVADMFYPWTADLAIHLGIPRLHFNGSCLFFLSIEDATRHPDSPHWKVQSDYDPFILPNLPDQISMTRSQLPDYVRDPEIASQLVNQWKEAELRSYGVIVNSFDELEPAYTQYYQKITSSNIFNIGPVGLIHRNTKDKAERVHKAVVGETQCLSWLNSKKLNSVLYVCFGSGSNKFPDEQLMELAYGLEASGQHFIWVVHGKGNDDEDGKWLPKDFNEKTRDRGMILKGWAPQLLILDHPSVGGFLTHCGWNSLVEGVSSGVPLITWPLHSEQFYNEKLVTQVLRIGVEVGAQDWCQWNHVGKKVIKRERIEKAIKMLMDGGDEAIRLMRQKARDLGDKAKRAVVEGGSSHTNLTILIEELKSFKGDRYKVSQPCLSKILK